MKASVMVEKKKEFAVILAFDVKVDEDARKMAAENGVKIFTADIIYHLFDQFTKHMEQFREEQRAALANVAVFPSICKILPTCIFNKKDPIVVGINVADGVLRVGTPLCIPEKDNLVIGKVIGLEVNHKPVEVARKGQDVAVSIQAEDSSITYGRQFDHSNQLVSLLSRESINALKEFFRDDMKKDDWRLVIKLKKVFDII